MPALGYKKSRTGCLRCKQRRVKCDENRPCRACVRHGVACTLVAVSPDAALSPSRTSAPGEEEKLVCKEIVVTSEPSTWTRPDAASQTSASASPLVIDAALRVSKSHHIDRSLDFDPFPYFARSTAPQAGQSVDSGDDFSMVDLELMHHWSTHTCLTLPRSNDVNSLWQFLVPRMAFKHRFLMNQLLALSAFHLAYLNPDRSDIYSLQASRHQDCAFHLLRLKLAEISTENCDALFAASLLLLFGGFSAAIHRSAGLEPSVDAILDIFMLNRGINGVLKTAEPTIATGPLRDLFGLPKHPTPSLPASLQALLEKVTALRPRLMARKMDDHVRSVVDTEIISLISCIHNASATAAIPEVRLVSIWPIYLHQDFIDLLRQRHPATTALLVYFCVVLCTAESKFWYLKGWGLGVATSIATTIDSSWKDLIEWPMGYIAAQDAANRTRNS
ncbi:hypothetical protein GQ53DRAFT_713324 [Thozetella sp. PMI_491]|nr:hypothetical protein GQ53DRAFT_713324 [Thozetella sp. PMI_491]